MRTVDQQHGHPVLPQRSYRWVKQCSGNPHECMFYRKHKKWQISSGCFMCPTVNFPVLNFCFPFRALTLSVCTYDICPCGLSCNSPSEHSGFVLSGAAEILFWVLSWIFLATGFLLVTVTVTDSLSVAVVFHPSVLANQLLLVDTKVITTSALVW